MARCAGVQNVSRPMVMCHEMSQMTPTTMLVDANSTAGMCHGMARVRACVRDAAVDGERTVTPIRSAGCRGRMLGLARGVAPAFPARMPDVMEHGDSGRRAR